MNVYPVGQDAERTERSVTAARPALGDDVGHMRRLSRTAGPRDQHTTVRPDRQVARPARLVRSGLVELATGALSGWIFTLARTQPELAKSRLGIQNPARIRQWHLDLAALGTATIACGLAVPEPPRLAATALGVGAWTNAMAFLPLAFKPDLDEHPAYLAFAAASFVATTLGFTGMALAATRRSPRAMGAASASPTTV